ncbi:CarboxypepD_reg-like domain-containing protein [Chitinophaga rupis]|uniref:CarboxypepD_reg-like domain-containing protein n=2 Tax=Chitinophaga rupis TaxID=573321 RepID=A0A1H8JLB2_9BACT|nr:CarboxypepD_reg-like domain-containing protein [Chitinophaga rupis]
MAKQSSLSLSVPNPCQQAWNEMTPSNEGHFCSHCNKTVIDFTQLTDEQVAAVFKNTSGKICGRFTASQLDRDLNAPRPAHHNPFIPAAVMTAALVTAAVNSDAQAGKVVMQVTQTPAPAVATQPVAEKDTVPASDIIHTVSGKITDSTGAPLPWATIMIKNSQSGVVPDANGQFSLSIPENLAGTANIMVFSCVGYMSQEMPLTGTREQFANLKVVMYEYPMLMGDMVVAGGAVVRKRNLWQRVKYFFQRLI